jgi:hypothetical protein
MKADHLGAEAPGFAGTTDTVPALLNALDTLLIYAVPARTITSGDFVVGFSVANPAGVYPADLDKLSPSQQRSYISPDGINFTLLDSIPGLAGNLAIRAVVTVTH